jgi:urea transporter
MTGFMILMSFTYAGWTMGGGIGGAIGAFIGSSIAGTVQMAIAAQKARDES